MNIFEKVKLVAELAKETATEDVIDFGMLEIDDQEIFQLISSSVVEKFENETENKEIILLACVTKLLVENTVLNLKLLKVPK